MARRELRFKTFDEIREELARLSQGPLETTGKWSYFQILDHCAMSLENTMKGLERPMSWWRRNISGPMAARKIAAVGFLPVGIKGNPQTTADQRIEGDEKAALTRLYKAVEDFEKFEGKLSVHPRMGRLNKKLWMHFHAMHMANHLGYAKLKDSV